MGGAALLEKRLHLVEEAVAIGFHRHAAFLGEFHEQFFLLGGQFGGDLYFNCEQLIARSLALEARNAEAFKAQDFVRLRARRNFHHGRALQSRHFDLAAKDGGHEADRHVAEDVAALALKHRMGFHRDGDIEISCRPPIHAMFAFIRKTKAHAGFDAGWNVDGNGSFTIGTLPALTGRTRLRDDSTGSLALAAGAADAEKALLQSDLPGPLATRAGLDRRRRFCTGALTVCAGFPAWNLELGFLAVDRFFERDFEVVLEVVAAFGTAAAALSAEEIFEDVVEHVPESTSAAEIEAFESRAALRAGMAEHVIAFAFVLIAEMLVGFVDFFEFFFGSLLLMVARLKVGMVLAGQFAIGLLEVFV